MSRLPVCKEFTDKSLTFVLVLAGLVGVVYVFAQSNAIILYVLSSGLPPLLAFAAFAIAAAGLLRYGVRLTDRTSLVWFSFSLGILFWLLGESTWAVYALWYSVPIPYPSIADFFWLAGYVPLLYAMFTLAWPFREGFSTRKMLVATSSVILLATLILVVLVPQAYASKMGQDLAAVSVGLAYPMLDVVLLMIALPVLFLFASGTFWRPFRFIVIGLTLTFCGDILFSWATLNGVYYDGSYLELFFHWSYIALAYGFYLRFKAGTGADMIGRP